MQRIKHLKALFYVVTFVALTETGCGKMQEDMQVEESVSVEIDAEELEPVMTEPEIEEELPEPEAEVEEPEEKEFVLPTQVDIGLDTEEGLAFEEFLEGKIPAVVGENLYQGPWDRCLNLETGQELYLQDFIDITGYKELADVQYALIDCGRDGQRELTVRIEIGIPLEGFYQLVLGYRKEKINLMCMVENMHRSGTDIDAIGYVYNYASEGIDGYFKEYGILDKEGKYEAIYEVSMATGFPRYEPGWAFWGNGEEDVPIELDETIIEGKTYYEYYIYADEHASKYTETALEALQQKCEEYIELCKTENNIQFITEEELDKLIKERMKKVGATRFCNFYENEYLVEWHSMVEKEITP